MKIPYARFEEFHKDYFWDEKYLSLRFGQAFVFEFFTTALDRDPELFYETVYEIAFSLIMEKYIESEE